MRILFVEDHQTFIAQLVPLLEAIPGVTLVQVRTDRDSAIEALRTELFDVVVLDLTIPPTGDVLDVAPEHGQTVFHEARAIASGTPVYILTGSEPDEFSLHLVRYGETIDLWGTRTATNTVDYFVKESADKLIAKIQEIAPIIAATNAITIDTHGRNLSLTAEQRRILRVVTRHAGGVSCVLKQLDGGLSEAKVLKVTIKDAQGHVLAVCAGKLGSSSDVMKEHTAYDRYVKHLGIGAFPPVFALVNRAVGNAAGLFYTLADDDAETFFELLDKNADGLDLIVRAVRDRLHRWTAAAQISETTIATIRQRMLDDATYNNLQIRFDLKFLDEVEARRVRVAESCIHGDLHGGNILVEGRTTPVLIDFGDVGPGYCCIDPVTLELSLIFHPAGQRCAPTQSLVDHIEQWPDIDQYLAGNPVAPIVAACREWAYDVGGSDRAVLAAGYAYTVRQLNYKTVDPKITLRLLGSIASRILSNDT